MEPGESHEDHVEVTNYSEQTVQFALLASDGVITDGGTFDLLPTDTEPVDAGAWVEIAPELELEPLGSAVVPFTLSVPDDALPGDHPGGIVASLSSVGEDDAGNAVTMDTRAGARIHLRVAGDVIPSLGIDDVRLDYRHSWNPFAPGTAELTWDVVNDGNVRLGAEQAADVAGLLGLGGGTVNIEGVREILPGQSAPQSAMIEAWPVFRLTADLTIAPVLVGTDDVVGPLSASVTSVTVWAVPWVHLTLLVLVGAVVIVLVRRRRKRRATFAAALEAARKEGARDTGRDPALTAG